MDLIAQKIRDLTKWGRLAKRVYLRVSGICGGWMVGTWMARRSRSKVVSETPPEVSESPDSEATLLFSSLINAGDRARDSQQWEESVKHYRSALDIRPSAAGYWVQLGHCLKEQGNLIEAEISYRNAEAMGVRQEDYLEHLEFVCRLQGHTYKRPIDPVSAADVEIAGYLFLNRTNLLQYEIRDYMRMGGREGLFSAMIGTREFVDANHGLLRVIAMDAKR